MQTKSFLYWLPVYAYAGLIFYISSLPTIPEPIVNTFKDWILHMIEYSILGVLLFRAFLNSQNMTLKAQAVFLAVLIAIIYGITDELHQYFVPGRVMSSFDIVANSLGSGVAVLVASFTAKFKFSKLYS